MAGFRLVWAQPGSLYARLGLVGGDTVRRINGFALDGPESALAIYGRLREASQLDVELERSGTVLRREYEIR